MSISEDEWFEVWQKGYEAGKRNGELWARQERLTRWQRRRLVWRCMFATRDLGRRAREREERGNST